MTTPSSTEIHASGSAAALPGSRHPDSGIFDLSDEVVVVIGGTGTLGGYIAESLAGFNARVAVMGRSEERGKDRVKAITGAGGIALFQGVDAIDNDSLRHAERVVADEFGPTTVLFNAAGGNHPKATLLPGESPCNVPEEAWRHVFDLNLMGGALFPSLVFGEAMLAAGRGSIINIASMAGMNPVSRVGAYSAAKAAVINLTKYLALEWATRGVRVNAISPGFFPADQNRKLLYNEDGSMTDRSSQIINHTPMARFGSAKELAGAAVWLAAPKASSFVTGQNIVVDGGFSIASI
ncbi:putative oxidoreductase UxuB [Pseudobythopirellula maris]|uniref:Putative oxidoreductase UxuB n=1 Tax=Pseudobythopirellula maris TaxID=2527991 RepID=A0A5C5ZTP2_9BACT|nr:SDR family oxidoreductase [Pseudobythopirellula maris]TWT90211.1 putative oxidoreductase UxuB [Pseudobythopirellula maris]